MDFDIKSIYEYESPYLKRTSNICSHVLLWPKELHYDRCVITDRKIDMVNEKNIKKGDTLLVAYALANKLALLERN